MYKYYSQFMVLISAFLLTACATMIQPETIKQKIYAASEQTVAAYHTANRLHDTGVLSDDEFREVLDHLEDASIALRSARDLANAGEDLKAEDKVTLANNILLIVRNALQEAQNE